MDDSPADKSDGTEKRKRKKDNSSKDTKDKPVLKRSKRLKLKRDEFEAPRRNKVESPGIADDSTMDMK